MRRLSSGQLASALLGTLLGCAAALPAWVRQPHGEFPDSKYVAAVGAGRDLESAKRDALNGIAAFLGVDIRSAAGVYASESSSAAGERASLTRVDESVNSLISQKLSSVVVQRAHSAGPTTYVLALLEKRTFLLNLANDAANDARLLGEGCKQPNPTSRQLQNLTLAAGRLQALHSRMLALGGEVDPASLAALRACIGFLAGFDVAIDAGGGAPRPAENLFDPDDPRLLKAKEDCRAILSRPVEFNFNLAQMPKERAFFDQLFDRYIGLVPKDLERLSLDRGEREQGAWRESAAALRRIDFDYDGSAERASADFDRKEGRLRIVMTSWNAPIPSGLVRGVLIEDYWEETVRRLAGREPEQVAAADHPTYFTCLTESGRKRFSSPEERFRDEMGSIDRAVRLYELSKNAPLRERIRTWLCEQGSVFGRMYVNEPAMVKAAPADSPLRRAERRWIAWINAGFDGLPDADKAGLLPQWLGFFQSYNDGPYNDFAYPGMATADWGLGTIDKWIRAGKPARAYGAAPGDTRQDLFDKVVSPVQRNRQGFRGVANSQRNGNWYHHMLRSPARKKQLLEAVIQHKDPILAETAMANLITVNVTLRGRYNRDSGEEFADLLDLWRGLEGDDRLWRAATAVIAEEPGFTAEARRAIYDETAALWRKYPKRRGSLLYLLALLDPNGDPYDQGKGLVPWRSFDKTFGAAVTRTEFAEYLNQGFRAVTAAAAIWPALEKGWSKAGALVPRLDAYMDEPLVPANNFQNPAGALRDIIHRMEEEPAELAQMHAYLKKRVSARPSEERPLSTLIELTKPK